MRNFFQTIVVSACLYGCIGSASSIQPIVDYILEPSSGTELAMFQNIPAVIFQGPGSQ